MSDDSAMARGPGGMRRGLGLGHQPSNLKSSIGSNRRLSKRHATREWNDVLHVDPDEVGTRAAALTLCAAGHTKLWGASSGLHRLECSKAGWNVDPGEVGKGRTPLVLVACGPPV